MVSIEFIGITEFQQQLVRLARQVEQAMQQAIQAEAERILESSFPLVPVDSGLLLSTGMTIAQPQGADIRYGGHGIAPYAAIVHERVGVNHPNGGQDHFLSQPLFAATGDMLHRLAADIAPQLRR